MQQTTLRFSLPEKTDLSVQITDAAGRVVESWLDHDVPAGPFSFVWDVKEHPAGMYYFVVSSGQGRFAGNIMVQK
jgi:flagellar hook assembly protein FlgD